jgi:N-acyl homoserine lactone hydrolase
VAAPRLYLFDSGTLTAGGVEVPVPFFLIRHPDGDVIVDGGNPLQVARDPEAHWGGLASIFVVNMTEEQHCASQLERLGVDPASVRYVLQTHLHIDHTGALGHFPSASVVVHERELAAARAAPSPGGNGYTRADIDQDGLDWQPIEDAHDLFGDGSVRTVFTPGHSAGHQSILLSLAETGKVLLTGDASDTRRQFDGLDPPRVLHSREEADASLERLRPLAEETGALVIPGHDPVEWARFKKAPEFYA